MKNMPHSLFCLGLSAFLAASLPAAAQVRSGLETLLAENLDQIRGQKVGVVANQTSCDSQGRHILDLLAPHAEIKAVFALEHGIFGNQEAGESVSDRPDPSYKVYSLYGKTKKPTAEMLEGLDLLFFDVQDVGVRFYTYTSSLYYVLQAARENDIPVWVLDRPNPIRADRVGGPILDLKYSSFVGIASIPICYGMTPGELAVYFNHTIQAELYVSPMVGYSRKMEYDETGLPWIPPSPNIPTFETALVYPGTCLLEGTNLSEGRGTDAPFLTVGAPFINAEAWREAVPADYWRGVTAEPISFTPRSIPGKSAKPKFMDQPCRGLRLTVTDRDAFRPIELGVGLLAAARKLYPKEFEVTEFLDKLWGNDELRRCLQDGDSPEVLLQKTREEADGFSKNRETMYE